MLQTVRYIVQIMVVLLAAYGLITKNFELSPLMMFFLSLMLLLFGLEEHYKKRTMYAWMLFAVSIFALYASVQGFLLS